MNTAKKHTETFDTSSTTGQTISRGKYIVCPMCHNIKYKKQWYAPDSKVALLANGSKARSEARHCPACEMKLEGLYSAVVVIHDVPKELRYRIESIIENEAENATYHNPQNRVLEIIETLDGYEVRTTSAKVARSISDKLKSVFKASEVLSKVERVPFDHHKTDVVLCIANYL